MGNPDLPTPKHIVDKLCEAATKGPNHRYSQSKGIPKLRLAITDWYQRNFQVAFLFQSPQKSLHYILHDRLHKYQDEIFLDQQSCIFRRSNS